VQAFKVTITHEAGRFQGDSVLYLKNNEFRAKSEAMEPEFLMNDLSENLRKQLAKFKGKISGKQKGEGGGLGRAMFAGTALTEEGDEAPEGFVLMDLDVAAAREKFQDGDLPFLVFRNIDNDKLGVVYRRDNGELGLMEAAND
jgi:hypothetical protein